MCLGRGLHDKRKQIGKQWLLLLRRVNLPKVKQLQTKEPEQQICEEILLHLIPVSEEVAELYTDPWILPSSTKILLVWMITVSGSQ